MDNARPVALCLITMIEVKLLREYYKIAKRSIVAYKSD